jgi:hypothetical protein
MMSIGCRLCSIIRRAASTRIPSLPDKAEWNSYEAARRAMSGKISRSAPASRYKVQTAAT